LWLDDTDSVSTYLPAFNTLGESAVYGADAQSVISRAQRTVRTGS
jgi:hypothetical protein